MNTMNALITATFFAPMALLVLTNLLTARTDGPTAATPRSRRSFAPLPTNRAPAPAANSERFLEAA